MLERDEANDLAKMVESELPKNTGFCLLLFPFNDDGDGRMQYISNGNRDDIVKAMQEWIAKVKDDNFGKDL